MNQALLQVKDLHTFFQTDLGVVRAVDGISFSLNQGDTLGIVGESGSGKTVTALSILRLIAIPPGKIESKGVLFEGKDLLQLSKSEMRRLRGNKISMVFQEPMTSLNPVFRIGEQISEAVRLHQGVSRKKSFEKAVEMLHLVGIPSPQKRASEYPHQMSGGMRQRVMIAMALSCKPKLMIADEPTTALDVTIQAQILNLMRRLKEETGTSIILITHNMGVVAEMAQHVMIMYAGRVMEQARAEELFENPLHPYTSSLLRAIPRIDQTSRKKRLHVIPGMVPSMTNLPLGCKYQDRCDQAFTRCFREEPEIVKIADGRTCRCWIYVTREH